MFTNDELRMISIQLWNRSHDVQTIADTKVYSNQEEKRQDLRYAQELRDLAEKCDSFIK